MLKRFHKLFRVDNSSLCQLTQYLKKNFCLSQQYKEASKASLLQDVLEKWLEKMVF
jgi:hypothetical protein